ncbi:9471_t:CDS:2 [Rhizophagus irregularis]|nr:9471_t:CDS:2 [Rhizophagus irregularis]
MKRTHIPPRKAAEGWKNYGQKRIYLKKVVNGEKLERYSKSKQHNRPAERSCPFAKTSIEAELLCDYWDVSTEYITLWNEIEAMVDDFPKVSALVRSQLKFALRDEAIKQLYEFEKDMLEVEYKVIRDRKLKELELDDDLLSKPQ